MRTELRSLAMTGLGAVCALSVCAAARPIRGSILSLSGDGAWCWFADPRAVFHRGAYRRTYAGWVDSAGVVWAAAYDHARRTVESSPLGRLRPDDHDHPALLVRPDGRLMAFYSGHHGRRMYYRLSRMPEDVTAWGPERTLPVNDGFLMGYTYPNPVQLPAERGRIYLFWRGGNWQPALSWSDDGSAWAPARRLVHKPFQRPYVKVAGDGADTIHIAFTDGHPGRNPDNSIYYVRYRDGAFSRADGTVVRSLGDLPLRPQEADKVYDGSAGAGRAWLWDVAADSAGRPVLVYAVMPSPGDHRYFYARWNGASWESHFMVSGGGWFPRTPAGRAEPEPYYSGGIALDHGRPSDVYLSRRVDGVFEIERWSTSDGGARWRSRAVTAGSAKDNVRPVVPPGAGPDGPRALWMHGDYVSWRAGYRTGIRMLLP